MRENALSHVDENGKAEMVNVGAKTASRRLATAEGRVCLGLSAVKAVRSNEIAKGDVLGVARIAGIAAAKRTDELIPLCHTLPLDSIDLKFEWEGSDLIIRATAEVTAKTGVEMEAMVACTAAALTIYDMCKAVDKGIEISSVRLLSKSGGKSGDFVRGG